MDSQELRGLQEAYSQVYDEAYKSLPHEKMIAKSNEFDKQYKTGPTNTDALRRRVKIHLATKFHDPKQSQQKSAANKNRPESEKRSKTVEPQNSFGNRLTRSDKQGIRDSYEYDLYDIILSHLLDEGFASDEKSAEAIMGAMSEAWVESIVEGNPLPDMVNKVGNNVKKGLGQVGNALGIPGSPIPPKGQYSRWEMHGVQPRLTPQRVSHSGYR